MNPIQHESDSPPHGDPRPRRTRSVASHPATPGVAFALTLAAFLFLLWLFGPINLKGSKRELGLFFVALALPICGVVWLYDPIVKRLDRWLHPELADRTQKATGPVPAEKRDRAYRLSRKSRETHPVSTNAFTPYLFAAVSIALFLGLNWLIYQLLPNNDAGAGTYIAAVATVLASIRAYDPIIDRLDSWFGQTQS